MRSWNISFVALSAGLFMSIGLAGCGDSPETAGPKYMDAARYKETAKMLQLAKDVKGLGNYKPAGSALNLLNQAAYAGELEVVEAMVANGADVTRAEGMGGGNVIHSAAAAPKNSGAMIRKLAAAKADVNLKNTDGETALMSAAFWGRLEAVEALLAVNADVLIVNSKNQTALDLAKRMRANFEESAEGGTGSEVKDIAKAALKKSAGDGKKADLEKIIVLLEGKK